MLPVPSDLVPLAYRNLHFTGCPIYLPSSTGLPTLLVDMASLLTLPSVSDAFTQYRPSKNAHTDFLSPNALGKRRDSTSAIDRVGPRIVKLTLKGAYLLPSHALWLTVFTAAISEPPVEEQLADLDSAIQSILSGKSTVKAFHHISSTCHRLVLPPHDAGDQVHKNVRHALEASVSNLVRDWRGSIMSREGGWLGKLVEGWRTWEQRVVSRLTPESDMNRTRCCLRRRLTLSLEPALCCLRIFGPSICQ
jgi:hypothetical protein